MTNLGPGFVIETDQLVGGYGKSLVLRQVSLRVSPGSIYGFLGPNGAGKTTALRMIVGLLQPFSGSVRLFGETLPAALPGILRRAGTLIEQPFLYDHLTGIENLEIAALLKGCERPDLDCAIAATGIRSYVGFRTREYSRGMRQRLGVALALLGNPELLILDEPMNGMDVDGLRAFRELLRMLNREHETTVLLSSHQFEEVEEVATHIGIMSETGDLLFQGSRRDLSERVPQRLVIKVQQRDEALGLLMAHNFVVDAGHEHLVIQGGTAEMARAANQLLVMNGVEVDHLEIEMATLESLFNKVLKTVKAWDSL